MEKQFDLEIRTRQSRWMTYVLMAAALFSFTVCIEAFLKPEWLFQLAALRMPVYPPTFPMVWQCLCLMIGILGIGYLTASANPLHHWPIVLVGWIGKIAVPLWLLSCAAEGRLSWQFADRVTAAEAIWWIPFGLILWRSYSSHTASMRVASPEVHSLALRIRTNRGQTLQEMSQDRPLLLVFLRHRGCPFCRETLVDLRQQRREIERTGFQIVLVQMDRDQTAHEFLYKYGLSDLPRISDENKSLYRAFGLRRGELWNLIGPPVWLRGIKAIVLEGNGIGLLYSDPFQMPGVFAIYQGQVVRSFMHRRASDRPNYVKFVQTA
ncbi:MAG TPA: SelL-related redox protein [Bryobacteraceae bacterium]|nr:SelL-related redox protein [Bryobacteraceae bacterium]